MNIPFIDLQTQYKGIEDEVKQAFDEILESCQFILGPAVTKCEEMLAEYTGSKFALSCASGTDALVMALLAMDVGYGDEVIVPGFSFFATAEAVSLVGAKPKFVDIDPVTFNIDPELLEAARSAKTKAVIPVGLYGQTADMDKVCKWAQSNNIRVIEDAAQSFGASYNGKKSGNLADISCTSFFPAKPLGCYGDGGAVFTNDVKLATSLRQIRMHGEEQRYVHGRLGINGRMDSLQCAVISIKLPKFDGEIKARQDLADSYTEAFSQINGISTPKVLEGRTSAWAQYTLRVPNRSDFQTKLKEVGIPTAVHYPSPMYRQKVYHEQSGDLRLTHCEKACHEVVSLPMHPYMKDDHRDHIIESVTRALS